jgi:hypothetical protein
VVPRLAGQFSITHQAAVVGYVTVKLVALVPVPAGVVTEIGPVVAPAGTRA